MKIGIDLRQVALGPTGGAANHLKAVFESLFSIDSTDEFIVFCTLFNRQLLETGVSNVRFITLPLKSYFADLDQFLINENIDILFRGYPIEDTLIFPPKRTIYFLPDLQHESFPEFFSKNELRTRRIAIHRALSEGGGIATNTEFTQKTIVDDPWTFCSNVFLITPGLLPRATLSTFNSLTQEEQELLPTKQYFYYPANLWPHKNHRRILQAFDLFLKHTGRSYEMIFTGYPDGWEKLHTEFPNLPVRHLGFVRPAVVRHLLERASALTFFSLYEGFGLPLLEAFDAGTPVICSNTTSIPEVGGDAVLYCDPMDVNAISHVMEQVVTDVSLREQLITRGHERLSKFTWEQAAINLKNAFIEIYDNYIHDNWNQQNTNYFPLVSIVTPSYNQGKFLRKTIESVLNQTYKNIEYIVIDGGSTDESKEILKSYGDRFSWISEPDQGQTDAINKGLIRAKGDILAYLNSDDVLLPNAVATIIQYFATHPACDLVYGRANYIDENDRVIGPYRTEEYSFGQLLWDDCICQPATFWRSRVAHLAGLFDTTLHYVMDYEYWMRVDRSGGKIEHIHDLLAYSRLYPETKTMSAREKIYLEDIQTCQKHGGYVSLNYFVGIWHQRIWEQGTIRALILRKIPKNFYIIGRIHYLWHNRQLIFGTLKHRLKNMKIKLATDLDNSFTRKSRMKLRTWIGLVNSKYPVLGVNLDNMLDPVVKIYITNRSNDELQYLTGIPLCNGEVRIMCGIKTIKTLALTVEKRISIEFIAQKGQIITIQFTGMHENSPFILDGTNMFAEIDLSK